MTKIVHGLSWVRSQEETAAKKWDEGLNQKVQNDWNRTKNVPSAANTLAWNTHDRDTRGIVSDFNIYLANTSGYQRLDWLLIKAITLVETSPDSKEWDKKPMQSANSGDSGLSDLLSSQHKVKMELIVPLALRHSLSYANSSAADNITAGVAYLLFKAAHFGEKTEVTDSKIYTVTVERHDDLYGIAQHVGTTVAVLEKLNNGLTRFDLKPGMELKYQKTENVTVIEGWNAITPNTVYGLYNRNRRLKYTYAEELNFTYDLIKQNKFLQ